MPLTFPASLHDPSPPADAMPRQMVVLAAGGEHFAVPIEALREIIPPRPFAPLPGSAAYVCGLTNVRGRIVTTLDLGARLGSGPCSARPDYRIVLFEHAGTLIGLAVESIVRIVAAEAGPSSRSAELLRALHPHAPFLRGIGSADGCEFAVLDPDELFRPVLP